MEKGLEDENTRHKNTRITTEQSSAGVSPRGRSAARVTDGPAHAGSREAGVKLQGQSEVAFGNMADDAVEDAEKSQTM